MADNYDMEILNDFPGLNGLTVIKKDEEMKESITMVLEFTTLLIMATAFIALVAGFQS